MSAGAARATDFNAGTVLREMSKEQQTWYVSGVVDALAYARFLKDAPAETGMQCIYDWYFTDNATLWENVLNPTFERYADKPVPAIIHALTKKKCGEAQ
ncbi:hypothetical protein ACSSV1_004893 [Labrenzia sp. MBR-25]|jgi:hypothetical protein